MAIDEYIDFENEIEEKESQSISNEVRKPTGKSVSFFSHPIKYTLMAVGAAYMALAPGGLGVKDAHAGEKYYAASEAYASTNPNQGRYGPPSTHGWKYIGQRDVDYEKKIPGKETIAKGYQKGNTLLIVAYFKKNPNNPYGYWFINKPTNETFNSFVDKDADGYFETYIAKGKSNQRVDLKKWGYQS